MQYLRARYYDAGTQRFVQEDDYRGSYTNPISMNRYAYTHNNPVMGVDPSGYATSSMQLIDGVSSSISTTKSTRVENPIVTGRSSPIRLIDGESLSPNTKSRDTYYPGTNQNSNDVMTPASDISDNQECDDGLGEDEPPEPFEIPEDYYYQKVNADEIDYANDMPYEIRNIYHTALSNYYNLKGLTAAIGAELPYYNGYVESLTQELSQLRGEMATKIGWLIFSNITTIAALGITLVAVIGGIAAVIASGGAAIVFMPALMEAVAALTLVTADDYVLLFDALQQFKPEWKEYRKEVKNIKSLLKDAKGEQYKAQYSYDYYEAAEKRYEALIESIENGTYKEGDEKDIWQATTLPTLER